MSIDELVARLRRADRPLPEVTVDHGPAIPGWVLRLAFTAAVPLFVYAVAARTPVAPGIVTAVAVGTAVWAGINPSPAVSHLTVLIAGPLLLTTPGPFDPSVLWLAPLGYAMTRLGWWASHTGLRTRVELAALGRAAARDSAVILVTLAIGAAAASLAGRPVGAVVALGSAALAALAWLALRRHDEDEHPQN
jgi:hypothetical protein